MLVKVCNSFLKGVILSLMFISLQAVASFPKNHPMTHGVGGMLDALRPTAPVSAPELNVLIGALDAQAPIHINDALASLVPQVDGGLWAPTHGMFHQVIFPITHRLDNAREKKAEQEDVVLGPQAAYSAGDELKKENRGLVSRFWAQVFGALVEQKERDLVFGYDADQVGAILGTDWQFTESLRLGLAGGYAQTEIDAKGPSGSDMLANSFYGMLYGSTDFGFEIPIYLDAVVGITYNEFYSSRKMLVLPTATTIPFARVARGYFDAFQFTAYLESGVKWQIGNFQATPKLLAFFSHINPESYAEERAGPFNLTVDYDKMNMLKLGGGGSVSLPKRF